MQLDPLAILAIGIVAVLGAIIVLRMNAFLALIGSAMIVSTLAPGDWPTKISRVAEAFGSSAGKIGVVIGLAAIIGKCMMDSGAADRIVRAFLGLLGEKRASLALMGSGFVLSVPVFFDTVFYLLVPLARALRRRTGRDFVKYVLAIAAGGAVTHTLVPPTPGPLVIAAQLGIDMGLMIMVGLVIAIPPAVIGGLLYASFANRYFNIPLRNVGGLEPEPIPDSELPGLLPSLLPVILPVILISANTLTKSLADREARLSTPVAALSAAGNNDSANISKQEPVDTTAVAPEKPLSTIRRLANLAAYLGDPNFALFLSTAIAMYVLYRKRDLTLMQLGSAVEDSLMSGGVIILITSAGGAFGEMLKVANIGEAIQGLFGGEGAATGFAMLWLGFGVASVLKVAQGSSTVAMITSASMLAAMISSPETLGFHPVYLATAIGSGSLVGSWMNDSGFWIVAKMSGFTEMEALKTWTVLLAILGIVAMLTTLLAATLVPTF